MKGVLYTDGACLGNPGPMGLGVFLKAGDNQLRLSEYAGIGTNNKAEYLALIKGLKTAIKHGVDELYVYMDSNLVVQQINGNWRVKDEGLKVLHRQAVELLNRFDKVVVSHVLRDKNMIADSLSKKAALFKK